MSDVRVGEPVECRRFRGCADNTFVQRPELPSPTRGEGGGGENADFFVRAMFHGNAACDGGRRVIAVIVHDDDGKRAGIFLLHEACDHFAYGLRLIPRGNYSDDLRPNIQRVEAVLIRIEMVDTPEPAAPEKQVQPDGKRDDTDGPRRKDMERRRHRRRRLTDERRERETKPSLPREPASGGAGVPFSICAWR